MDNDEDIRSRAEELLAMYRQALADVEHAREDDTVGSDRRASVALHSAIWDAVYSTQVATLEVLLGEGRGIPVPDFIQQD
ncbi:hypothetical protein AA0Y32_06010 [Georgenia phoenicis]|uniref:hypothetical protein n=1 Tax=unclassified Georgenia TaxID=2626815 RepID=UPI0039AF120E